MEAENGTYLLSSPLIQSKEDWRAGSGRHRAMLASCPESIFIQLTSLSSGSFILSAPSFRVFPKPWRGWCEWPIGTKPSTSLVLGTSVSYESIILLLRRGEWRQGVQVPTPVLGGESELWSSCLAGKLSYPLHHLPSPCQAHLQWSLQAFRSQTPHNTIIS